MFDGFTILLIGYHHRELLNNSDIQFTRVVNVKTGELRGKLRGVLNGIIIEIIPSTVNKDQCHTVVRGSFAQYFNEGKGNCFDYTIENFLQTVGELSSVLNFDPKQAIIQRIEFGVNVLPSISLTAVRNALRTYPNKEFSTMRTKRGLWGYSLMRQQYEYKIYKKLPNEEQRERDQTPMLRLEYVVNSQKKLKTLGIKTLADLPNKEVIKMLSIELIKYWSECIYDNRGFDHRQMTAYERKKVLYYLDAKNWIAFDRKTRNRAKPRFEKLKLKYSNDYSQDQITLLICDKVKELTAVDMVKSGYVLRYLLFDLEAVRKSAIWVRFTGLGKVIKRSTTTLNNDSKSTNLQYTKKSPKNKGKKSQCFQVSCKTCNAPIQHKRKGTLYCSKKCNNSYQAQRKKIKKAQKREAEKIALEKYIMRIWVSDQYTIQYKALKLQQHFKGIEELKKGIDKKALIISVTVIRANARYKNIELTSYRARRLIKTLLK